MGVGSLVGYLVSMGILKKMALVIVGKKVYDEAMKPQNQRRIRAAMRQVRAKRGQASAAATPE